jgi:hypothetical protein
MFHLLVAYDGWPDGGSFLPNGRIYIKPDESPGDAFLTDRKLDIAKIRKAPALLVSETGGKGPQFAKVATIDSIAGSAGRTTIKYTVDTSVRPISNDDLEDLSGRIGFGRFTLTHTHWSVYDSDLFRLLLIHQQERSVEPNLFSVESIYKQERDLVSVMMPFNNEFTPVLEALKSATASLEWRCVRADDIWENNAIIQDIVDIIAKARVVVCDCTGKNPNVFYEIGIAHSLGKEVILITQSENDIPFDLRHLRYIQYLRNGEGLQTLSKNVLSRLNTLAARGR